MTQLASSPLADLIRQRITDRMAKRSRINDLIAQTRAAATPAQVERRQSPRLTLDELESLSQTELGQRLQSAGPEDTRSGFVKFFDLLDLPRNAIANAIIRPSLDSKAIAAKRTGAFGLPQITFSDALDAMGVEPGFARGAIGFVGDVALDPLTYLSGGASQAAKIGLKAGSVGIRKGTAKVLDKTIASLARGEAYDAARLSGRLKGLEGVLGRAARPEVIAAAKRAGKTENQIATMIRESVLGRTKIPDPTIARSFIQLTPEQLAGRLLRGETFTKEQLNNPELVALVRKAKSYLKKASKRGSMILASDKDAIPSELVKMVRDSIGEGINIAIPGSPITSAASFQPGLLARRVGADEGIASFLGREGRTKGLELRVPFTDTGIKLWERDARMKALRELEDASHFASEIGDAGTAYSDTLLHKVSTAIRGDAAPSQTPAYRMALANGLAAFDRGMQQYFGMGNRESLFGRQTRISENTLNAHNAVAHSMRINLDRALDKLVENAGPEEAEAVRNTIIAKLEIGIGKARYPDGRAIFGAVGDIDLSGATPATAAAVAKQIRDLKLAAIDAGKEHAWDEIFDHVADSLENGNWFNPRVNEYVARMRGVYDAIDESAIKSGIWERGLGNFASHTLTDEAAAAIRQQKLSNPVLKHGTPAEARILAEQGFEKHRTTNRYIWHDPETGALNSFYAFQLDDPKLAAKVKRAVEQGLVPRYGYQASVFHTNKLADGGSFASLLGPTWKGRMMDNNPASALASNYRQLQRAKIGRDFASYAHNFARSVDEKSFHKLLSESKVEEMPGQAAYRILADGIKDVNDKVIGNSGDLIRRVKIAADHPLYKSLGEGVSHFFDDRVATRIEDYASYYHDPAKTTNFLGLLDGVTSQMRTLTLAHPSWLLTNVSSNAISAALMGATPKDLPLLPIASRLYGRYQKIIKEGGAGLKDLLDETVEIGGRTFTNREIITVAEQTGVLEQGRIVRQIANTIGNSTQMLRDNTMKPTGTAAGVAGRFGQIYTKNMAKWFLANHSVEQRQRLWSMMTRIAKGDEPHQAALETIRHHFDYGDMTRFENDFMRKTLYFYPWVRNNTPFMLTKLFEDPKWAAAFPKLKVALEDTIAEEDRIPEAQRPSWFKNQLGTQIGSKTGLLLPMLTQFQDVAEVGQALTGQREDIKEFLHYITSQVNPIMQLPFELAAGREFFTGREIGDPDTGAMSVGEFVGGQFRPFREGTRLSQLIKSGADRGLTPAQRTTEILGRAIVGGRFQSMNPERAVIGNVASLADEAAKVRNQINVSIKDGDQQRAIRLTIKLESLWRQILEMDPESDRVPKSVRERLLPSEQTVPS